MPEATYPLGPLRLLSGISYQDLRDKAYKKRSMEQWPIAVAMGYNEHLLARDCWLFYTIQATYNALNH